jgi:geranylgeranyl reductase family protein
MNNYDIAVVGAGPVGSTFARYMAEEGFKVGLMERKRKIGVPLQCAGLVGKKIKRLNVLPDEFVLNRVCGAHLHSPSGEVLSVAKKKPEAYVLDRMGYDKFLAELAVENGVELLLNHKVVGADIKTGDIRVKNQEKNISTNVIVGADGYSSIVSGEFNPPSKTVQAAQYLVDMGSNVLESDYVHLYVDSRISPGFIWVIPVSESTARIGLFASAGYRELTEILDGFLVKNEKFRNASVIKKYHGLIPVYDPKKMIQKDRALLLGDAASQVKPTTGGGLIMGFKCARIAAAATSNALHEGDIGLLRNYERSYMKEYKNELRIQIEVRKIFESMSNEELDKMFLKLEKGGAEAMISKYGDMDTQSPLIKQMLKSGLLFSILPGILTRRISNLWK